MSLASLECPSGLETDRVQLLELEPGLALGGVSRALTVVVSLSEVDGPDPSVIEWGLATANIPQKTLDFSKLV